VFPFEPDQVLASLESCSDAYDIVDVGGFSEIFQIEPNRSAPHLVDAHVRGNSREIYQVVELGAIPSFPEDSPGSDDEFRFSGREFFRDGENGFRRDGNPFAIWTDFPDALPGNEVGIEIREFADDRVEDIFAIDIVRFRAQEVRNDGRSEVFAQVFALFFENRDDSANLGFAVYEEFFYWGLELVKAFRAPDVSELEKHFLRIQEQLVSCSDFFF
jgi:hypothetical protein